MAHHGENEKILSGTVMNALINALIKDLEWIDALPVDHPLWSGGPVVDFTLDSKPLNNWPPPLEDLSLEETEYHAQLGAALQTLSDNPLLPSVTTVLKRCESPIERIFITTFWLITLAYVPDSGDPEPDFQGEYSRIRNPRNPALLIAPQAQIEDMRVDFVLAHFGSWPNFDVREIDGAPRTHLSEMPGTSLSRVRVVIECDGHEFHEKTKVQAARDKARDRKLASQGFRVFRLTGAEIWRHPGRSAYEVARAIYDLAWDVATPSLG